MPHTALFHSEKPRLDAARIAGITAAVVLNAALAMVLLKPVNLAPLVAAITTTPPIIIIRPLPVQPKPPELPVSKPRPVTPQQVAARRIAPTISITPQRIAEQTVAADTAILTDPIGPATGEIGPVQSTPIQASLDYVRAPAPIYPRGPLMAGIEGTVQLRVLVDTNGSVLDVQVERSSGNRELDAAAREQVLRHWLFQPAQRNGVPMQAWGRVPIVFTLGGK